MGLWLSTTLTYDVQPAVEPSPAVPSTAMVWLPTPSVSEVWLSNVHDAKPRPPSEQVPACPDALLNTTPQLLSGIGTMAGEPCEPTQLSVGGTSVGADDEGATVTAKAATVWLFALSVAMQTTGDVPTGNVLPGRGLQTGATGPSTGSVATGANETAAPFALVAVTAISATVEGENAGPSVSWTVTKNDAVE